MGKLMHNTQIKHSSHPHLLQLSSNQNNCTCSGCNLLISSSDHIYACRPCNFFLHASCSKFPELITHPSHREHTLSLLPTSIYPGGFFKCDACTQQGTRFSYHCQVCDFDLHVLCASKPLSVTHPFHPHPLVLTFSSPYGEKSGFSCDVCHTIGLAGQWLYRCVSCEFDVHLHCATAKMQPPMHHSNSFSGATSVPPVAGHPLSHSMTTGHAHTNYYQTQNPAPVGVQSYQQPHVQSQPQTLNGFQTYQGPTHPYTQPQASIGSVSYQGPPQPQPQASVGSQSYQGPPQPQSQAPVGVQSYQVPAQPQPLQNYQVPSQPQPQQASMVNQNVAPGNGLADVMVTGFVDGMMQQLGQNFVQSLTGGGGGGGDVVNIDYECSTVNENYDN